MACASAASTDARLPAAPALPSAGVAMLKGVCKSTVLGKSIISAFSSDHAVAVSVAFALISSAFTGLLAMIYCISASAPIGNVKANIQDKKGLTTTGIFGGIPPDQRRLTFADKQLKEYGRSSRISGVLYYPVQQLLVQVMVTDTQYELHPQISKGLFRIMWSEDCRGHQLIAHLTYHELLQIIRIMQLHLENFRYPGSELLVDDRALSDNSIQCDSTISLMLDLRGGIQIFMKTFSSAWFSRTSCWKMAALSAEYDAHIQQEYIFQLVLCLGGGMHICVGIPAGKAISLDAEASDTIDNVKAKFMSSSTERSDAEDRRRVSRLQVISNQHTG